MLEIEKRKQNGYYQFYFKMNEGTFSILFLGNLDLYWTYIPKNIKEYSDKYSFNVTKENYFVYELLNKLFNDIKNNDNNKYTGSSEIHNLLFHDNMIEFYSDDFIYEEASYFTIEENKDTYTLTFNQSKNDDMFNTYAVRIRNSGSRYHYFNIPFMEMYKSLIDYEPNYHQIHIEEYMYLKKKIK